MGGLDFAPLTTTTSAVSGFASRAWCALEISPFRRSFAALYARCIVWFMRFLSELLAS
jgi:hypothetical protein